MWENATYPPILYGGTPRASMEHPSLPKPRRKTARNGDTSSPDHGHESPTSHGMGQAVRRVDLRGLDDGSGSLCPGA